MIRNTLDPRNSDSEQFSRVLNTGGSTPCVKSQCDQSTTGPLVSGTWQSLSARLETCVLTGRAKVLHLLQ